MHILNQNIQKFINSNLETPIAQLALQKNPFPELDFKIIINQIEAKIKSKHKLPTWFTCDGIIYPNKISIEQTSSEITAKYKTELVKGKTLIDVTGGFGVDSYFFSQVIENVTHCEIDADLSQIAAHNFKQLNNHSINCICGEGTAILEQLKTNFDFIYIDPSRRNDVKGKVFMLKDCLPNVFELQEFYYQYTNRILVKTAPLLDISAGLLELKNVKKINIVAVENEVKELLWEIEKSHAGSIEICTINFNKEKRETFNFFLDRAEISFLDFPKKYLYEPNAAIMKSGGFTEIGNFYNLAKIHNHSHLYTSNELIEFPGRVFEVLKSIPYSKASMKEFLESTKSNITTRNFSESVAAIRIKWKIKDGGTNYSFFTTDKNENKIVLICKKL